MKVNTQDNEINCSQGYKIWMVFTIFDCFFHALIDNFPWPCHSFIYYNPPEPRVSFSPSPSHSPSQHNQVRFCEIPSIRFLRWYTWSVNLSTIESWEIFFYICLLVPLCELTPYQWTFTINLPCVLILHFRSIGLILVIDRTRIALSALIIVITFYSLENKFIEYSNKDYPARLLLWNLLHELCFAGSRARARIIFDLTTGK